MDDLRVECYDSKDVAAKKHSISERAVVAGKGFFLTLGLFGLVLMPSCNRRRTPQVEEPTPQIEMEDYHQATEPTSQVEVEEPTPEVWDDRYINGGSGSWFVSILESA